MSQNASDEPLRWGHRPRRPYRSRVRCACSASAQRSSCVVMALATLCMSDDARVPALLMRRCLLTVVSWSAIALDRLPWNVTDASLGYNRAVEPVRGTTCTRFRCWFAASLLMTTAGLRFRISPLTDGSKLTHHTSPRFIGDIRNRSFCPLESFCFAFFFLGHLMVCR